MPTQIDNFTINNFSGLTIVEPFLVTGDFFLTNGIINNGANTITLSASSRINGDNNGEGTETSFVAGRMTKIVPFFNEVNGGSANFVFPVGTINGTDNDYSPLRARNYSAGTFGQCADCASLRCRASGCVVAFDFALLAD